MQGLTYVPDFITPDQEAQLVALIDNSKWNTSLTRRTQHYGYEYDYKSKDLKTADAIPKVFLDILQPLVKTNNYPNQVIVNEYLPGQGISKHTDASMFKDVILSLSLLSDINMIFRRNTDIEEKRLERRSLLVLTGDARWNWTHEIPGRKYDTVNGHKVERSRRISLTYRYV